MDDQQPVSQSAQVPDPALGRAPYPPYPYSPPFNTYAILSLVFGAMVFAPLGIYFGKRAKKEIARTGERGAELATAGIVVGWIFTVFYALFLLVWIVLVGTAIFSSAS
jgi:TctA family transporter